MSKTLLFVFLIVLSSACATDQPGEPPMNQDAEIQAVQQAVNDWLNLGVASLDTMIIASYMTPTFGSMEPNWRDKRGFLEWVMTFEEDFGGPGNISYSFSDWRTTIVGEVAWTSVVNDGTLTLKGEDPRYLKWTETGVLIKQSDGKWLIDRYHSTSLTENGSE